MSKFTHGGGFDEIIPNQFGAGFTGIFKGQDSLTIYREEDVTELVERNRALYNSYDGRRARWKNPAMNWVASIPPTVYLDLMRKGILQDKKAFDRWLDDPDNQAFRTRPGLLSR